MRDDRIGYLLKRVQAGLRAEMDAALEAKDLTTPQYAVLSTLEQEPEISNAELARRSFVTPQTMIRIVDNLESLRLIARQPHPTHGKVLMASLTPKGARLVASCHAAVNAVEARMLSGLNAAERSTLQALLGRCATALEDG
jgi:DNA-binding MarR family transcriptional regulator